MNTHTARIRPRTRQVAAACGVAFLLFAAAACGSGDNNNANATGQTYGGGGGPQDSQNGSDGRPPGVSGKVAAVDGSTAQVQGMGGQVAVTWTGSTTFTKDVSAGLADVKVGSCVLVGSAEQPSTGSSTPATKVTAANVRITPKANGSCGPGLRGPGGNGDGPQLQGAPPSGAPKGGGQPQMRAMGGAVGEVTAVSATGFTVDSVMPSSSGDTQKTAVAVTVTGDTTYTTSATGAASDVKVGVCVAADGDTDDTGAVTAETIAISQPQDGQCGGFMRFKSGDGDASTQES